MRVSEIALQQGGRDSCTVLIGEPSATECMI